MSIARLSRRRRVALAVASFALSALCLVGLTIERGARAEALPNAPVPAATSNGPARPAPSSKPDKHAPRPHKVTASKFLPVHSFGGY